MPRIPEQVRPGLSIEVPGAQADTSGAGAVGAGLARLGASMANSGFDMAEKMKIAEAQNAVGNAKLQDEIEADKFFNDLKLKHSSGYITENGRIKLDTGGNPVTVGDEFKNWANKRYQDNQASMPSDLAQRMYQQEAAPAFTDRILKAKNSERVMQLESYNNDLENKIRIRNADIITTPSLSKVYRYANDVEADIKSQKGVLYDESISNDKVTKAHETLALGVIKGAYNQILAGAKNTDRVAQVNTWRSILAGQDAASKQRKALGLKTLGEMLPEDKRAQVEEDLIRLAKIAKQMDHDQASVILKDANASLLMGKDMDTAFRDAIPAINTLSTDTDGNTKEFIKADLMANVASSAWLGRLVHNPSYVFGGNDERDSISTSAQGGIKSVPAELERKLGYKLNSTTSDSVVHTLLEKVRQDNEHRTKAQQHDIVKYALSERENFPSVFTATAQMENVLRSPDLEASLKTLPPGTATTSAAEIRSLAKRANAPLRVMTKETSEIFANNLKNSTNASKTAYNVIALKNKLGDDFNTKIEQVIADKNLPESWRYVAMFSDNSELTKNNVMRLLAAPSVYESFKKRPGNSKELEMIDAQLNDRLKGVIVPILKGNSKSIPTLEMTQQAYEAQRVHAMQLVMTGTEPDEAANIASHEFLRRFAIVPGHDLPLPASYKTPAPYRHEISFTSGDLDKISGYLTNFKEKLSTNDFFTPNGANPDRYLAQIQRQGQFVFTQNPAGTQGVALQVGMNLDGQGNVRQQFMLNKDGSVFFVPLHELSSRASSFTREKRVKITGTPGKL